MLVKARSVENDKRGASRDGFRSLRVTALRPSDPLRRKELQRRDRVGMASVVSTLMLCPDATLTSTWDFDPAKVEPKLGLSYAIETKTEQNPQAAQRLFAQLKHTLQEPFEVIPAVACHPSGRPDDPPTSSFAIESTLDDSCLSPTPGRWSNGQPLAVRDNPDWAMALQVVAGTRGPITVTWSVGTTFVGDGLGDQLDLTRRAWELHRSIDRIDRGDGGTRQLLGVSVSDGKPSVGRLPTADAATRWPTTQLTQLAEIAGGPSVRMSLKVSSSTREDACMLATALCESIFEPGTARVVDVSACSGSAHGPLMELARTVLRARDAVRLLTFPRIDSPNLMPVAGCGKSKDYNGASVGMCYDELIHRPSDVAAVLPWRSSLQHVFLSGVNGSGKTVCLLQLAAEGARSKPAIPMLFISFAKEVGSKFLGWRNCKDPQLRAYARDLLIYGLHPESPLPIRINPVHVGDCDPDEAADRAYRVIKAGVLLEGPLGGNTLEGCSVLCHDASRGSRPAILGDLPDTIRQVQEDNGYSDALRRDIGGAFESRISELTKGLNGATFRSLRPQPAIEAVMSRPHVFSLEGVDAEIAAMFLVDFFLRLQQFLVKTASSAKDGRPRLVIFMDEVQVVAPRDPARAAGDRPVASAEAARLIRDAVKVMREWGVAVIFASQHPGSIDEELVKAPGSHIALAQNQSAEKAEIAGLLGLDSQQAAQLNGLERGHALFRGPGMVRAKRIVIPFEPEIHVQASLSDAAIAAHYAGSPDARSLMIRSCQEDLELRESRYLTAARKLRRDLRDWRELACARRAAAADTHRPDTASQVLREVEQAVVSLRRGIDRRSRRFEQQWARTLRPIPAWLTQWASQGKRHVKQRRAVASLCRRQDRLERAYRRMARRAAASLAETSCPA